MGTGTSSRGNRYPYGTEYKSLYQVGDIKFVKNTRKGSASVPTETQSSGRIYGTINKQNELVAISFYDQNGRIYKRIDYKHNGEIDVHTHYGDHRGKTERTEASPEDIKIANTLQTIWKNRNKQ